MSSLNQFACSGGQGDKLESGVFFGQLFKQKGQFQIGRPKIVAPFRYAVRFIHRQKMDWYGLLKLSQLSQEFFDP